MKRLILTLALITFAATAAYAGEDSNFRGTNRTMKTATGSTTRDAGDLKTNPGTDIQQTNPAGSAAPMWIGFNNDPHRYGDPDSWRHWIQH